MTSYKKSAGGTTEDQKESKALQDFRFAYEHKRKWLDEAETDYEFAMGKQWEDEDVEKLAAKGVLALTINKIYPNIQLLVGIESQNRTDAKAFPIGKEDDVKGDIVTALLKDVNRNAGLDYKHSEQFEDGLICGEGWLEPYLDYSDHPLFAKMKFRTADYNQFYPDPNAKEYDFSDGQFMDKVSFGLTEDQILMLYPELKDKLGNITGKLSLDTALGNSIWATITSAVDRVMYKNSSNADSPEQIEEPTYDLLEHYYKKYVLKYWVASYQHGLKEAASKEEAENYVKMENAMLPAGVQPAVVIKRTVYEIWCCTYVGNEKVSEDKAWYFPRWKGWPGVPYRAKWKKVPLRGDNFEILTQGITRGMKSIQMEFNKRRTQELRILNTSANSGWLTAKDSWVDPDKVEKFGSTPGVNLEYDPTAGPPPQRLEPVQLSQGHAQLAAEHSEDMKTESGINAEQLAMESGERSGRAIALRQKQGLVMVQKYFDNLSQTKKIMAKFVLSQLAQVYDVERAVRVLGDAFIQEHFSVPVMGPMIGPDGMPMVDPAGQPVMGPQIDPMTGQPQMQVDQNAVVMTFNQVLNDADLGLYDVAIGESAQNDTVRYANYLTLTEMAGAGIPIPPDVLVEESGISASSKQKILAAIQNAQAAGMVAPPKKKA